MKKVNVFTYCKESSYGSVLQSYSLKKTLESLGFDSVVFSTDKQPKGCCPLPKFRVKNIKQLFVYLLQLSVYISRNRRYKKNMRFIDAEMDVCYRPELSRADFSAEDIFLTGSDQVWKTDVLRPDFFLEYAPEGAKKLTYAVSMGVTDVPRDNEAELARMLQKFSRISVREADNIPALSPFVQADFDVHIDPTFLTEREKWRKCEKEYPIDKPYILVYPIYWDTRCNEKLKELHEKTGKDIVVIADYRRDIYASKWLYDVGIEQFLWLIDHADGVVSSSFHGVAMSLIFNKKLSAVINPAAPSRITSLLDTLGYDNTDIAALDGPAADYEAVNGKIEAEKQRSIAYLTEVLSQ